MQSRQQLLQSLPCLLSLSTMNKPELGSSPRELRQPVKLLNVRSRKQRRVTRTLFCLMLRLFQSRHYPPWVSDRTFANLDCLVFCFFLLLPNCHCRHDAPYHISNTCGRLRLDQLATQIGLSLVSFSSTWLC